MNWSRKWPNSAAFRVRFAHLHLVLLCTGLLLSACGGQEPVDSQEIAYFLPPTLSNTAESIVLITPTPIPPSPTPQCTQELQFIEDVTVPDGSAFPPAASIEKTWRVLNAGSCDWGPGYRLIFSGGELLGAEPEQALFPARSGSEAEISIQFEAPQQPGRYTSAWVAINPLGEEFGDVIFMDISVDDTIQPTESTSERESTA